MLSQPSELRSAFMELLNLALTRGSFKASPCCLENPDAEAASITDAYDAFQREHGHSDGDRHVDATDDAVPWKG